MPLYECEWGACTCNIDSDSTDPNSSCDSVGHSPSKVCAPLLGARCKLKPLKEFGVSIDKDEFLGGEYPGAMFTTYEDFPIQMTLTGTKCGGTKTIRIRHNVKTDADGTAFYNYFYNGTYWDPIHGVWGPPKGPLRLDIETKIDPNEPPSQDALPGALYVGGHDVVDHTALPGDLVTGPWMLTSHNTDGFSPRPDEYPFAVWPTQYKASYSTTPLMCDGHPIQLLDEAAANAYKMTICYTRPGQYGGATQDPHLHFPNGGEADLRGRDGAHPPPFGDTRGEA